MKVFLLLIFSFFFFYSYSQKGLEVSYRGESFKSLKRVLITHFSDSVSFWKYQTELIAFARKKGYVLASSECQGFDQDTLECTLFLGEKFDQVYLSVNEEDRFFVSRALAQREKLLLNLPFTPAGFSSSLQRIEYAYLNAGYPFVRLTVKTDSVSRNAAFCSLEIEKNKRYTWKEVHVKGDTNIRSSLLQNLLDIRVGDPYSEALFLAVSQKIKQVPYLQESKPAELLFTPLGVELYVYVNVIPLSSLNGFVGLQPNQDNTAYKLAGDINLKLLNVFHKGEGFDLNWRNLQNITQQFNTQLSIPYLFKTPFGIEGKFYLYKRDSSFLDVQSRVAINYSFTGNTKATFFYQRKSSNILKAGQNSTTYSNLANVFSNNYGLGFSRKSLDYSPNPTKGYVIAISGSVGQRTSQVNDTLPKIENLQINGETNLEWYVPIGKRNVLFFGNKSWSLNTSPLYQNELLRFGGLLWQRGFNEDDFFGSTVSTTSFEYRFVFDRDSRVFLFADYTWYENNAISYTKDTPYGLGAGFAFGTNIGTFSLIYAVGSQRNNPVLIQNGRVHFGYIAYF